MADELKEVEQKTEQTQVATQEHVNMVADLTSLYSSSDTLRIARNLAQDLSKSTIIPQQYQNNYANCLVALEMANRTNQSALQVMQTLDVIQGRPSWSAKALIGMINASGKYDKDLKFSYIKNKDGEITGCFAYTYKDGELVEGIPYTLEKAKKEGLLGKNNSFWNKDAELMLTYRAVSRFASINCPEISLGLYTSEEVRDMNYIDKQKSESKKATLNDILSSDDEMVNEVDEAEVIETVEAESVVIE